MNDQIYQRQGVIQTDENGDVTYRVVDRTTGEIYSLKSFNHSFDPSERQQIHLEFQTLNQLDHPNLVRCHKMWETADGKIHILLDSIDCVQVPETVTSKELSYIAHQLLLGLDYLHSKNIWHGNIEKSNIFVDMSTCQVKVFYFGKTLSRLPLILDDSYDYFYWDIWNLGLTILKLYMGCDDLKLDVSFQIEHHYTNANTNVESKDEFQSKKRRKMETWKMKTALRLVDLPVPVLKSSKDLWNFLRCCMPTNGSSRWNTTKLLLKHPFIDSASSSQKVTSPLLKRLHSSPKTSIDVSTITSLSSSSKTSWDKSIVLPEDYPSDDECWTEGNYDVSLATILHDYEPSYDICTQHCSLFPDCADKFDAYDKCIRHCSLFPEDFEFDMDKVVQLWIAEGCIDEEERMEDVAKLYFEELVKEVFVIPKKLDILSGKLVYKLNISKFANWSQKEGADGDYLRVREVNIDDILRATATRHLSFHCTTLDPKIFDVLKDYKQLRTLLLPGHSGCGINLLPNNIFLGLKLLRSLDLSSSSISELPSAIGNLESLRCLDVSETRIRQLPESTDRLSFLQTLRLRGCVGVRSLPKKFEKLKNLRHLDFDIVRQLMSMPKGMGSLIKLQTLHAFLVGNNDRCGIGELENLNSITGSFCISGLENVSSIYEAKQAALGNKKHLDMLELRWSDHVNENSSMDVEILECLQPHFGIKELKMICYKGSKLPCWISNPSFTNLANITLYKCLNCNILPSIGKLPSLRSLTIVEMNSLRDIDSIFCRNYGTRDSGGFRSLEKLTFDNMLGLEKWTGLEDGDFACLHHIAIRYCPKLSILPVLAHLRSLLYFEISHCSQLISLPKGGMPRSLESLIVRGCPNINEGCIKDEQDMCKIAHVTNIWIDFKKISLD